MAQVTQFIVLEIFCLKSQEIFFISFYHIMYLVNRDCQSFYKIKPYLFEIHQSNWQSLYKIKPYMFEIHQSNWKSLSVHINTLFFKDHIVIVSLLQ